jgi:hypothetical protein
VVGVVPIRVRHVSMALRGISMMVLAIGSYHFDERVRRI